MDYIMNENRNFFCKLTGYTQALFTNSASSAFHTFILSNQYILGDEIVFPVECYPTLPMIALQCGLKPVYVDVDDNFNISPEKLKQNITLRTKFVVVIHMAGIPADMSKIEKILEESNNNIILIEDICQAIGSIMLGGIKKGRFTKAVILSFSNGKLFSIDGGGLLLTDDSNCITRAKVIANNGYHLEKRFVTFGYYYEMHIEQHRRLNTLIKDADNILNSALLKIEIIYKSIIGIFKPIYSENKNILQHKIVTQVREVNLFEEKYDAFLKKYLDVAENHYPYGFLKRSS